MADNSQVNEGQPSPFTDVPPINSQQDPPSQTQGNSGTLGAFQVGPNQIGTPPSADNGVGSIGMISDSGNERFFVGPTGARKAVMGQLKEVTGSDEYGLWTVNGYFTGKVTATSGAISGTITVGDLSSNYIIIDGPDTVIKSSNYIPDVSGFYIDPNLIESTNIKARGALQGVTFSYNVISAVGGQLMVTNADALGSDMTSLDTATLTTNGSTTFTVNDILLIQATTASGIQSEWFRVTDISLAPIYTVVRDLAGLYAPDANPSWSKGTAVVKQGISDGSSAFSGGWLRLIGQGLNSPYYSVFSRTGINYNNYLEAVRLGNLNGIGPFVADTYGIFIGDYSSGKYLTYDDVSGQLNINGYVQNSKGVFGGDGSDGPLNVSSGITTIDCSAAVNGVFIKNYTSISITGTGSVNFSNAQGIIVVLKSRGNVILTSSAAPLLDASGLGGLGGIGQTQGFGTTHDGFAGSSVSTLSITTGAGGGGLSGGAGFVGKAAQYSYNSSGPDLKVIKYLPLIFRASGGGSGSTGVGGGGTGTATTGAGGKGGGTLIIECNGAWNFTTAGGISVAGQNGQTCSVTIGTSGSAIAAGAGGGGGGCFVCLYNILTLNSGTVTIAGGNGSATATAGFSNTNYSGSGGGGVAAGNPGTSSGPGGTGGIGLSLIAQNTVFA